jgi:hypothetical protein
MPGASNSGPVTRRQSKRKSSAVAVQAAAPAEEHVSKRIKTEANVQEQLQIEEGASEANELEIAGVDGTGVTNNADNSSSSAPEESELVPARMARTGELLTEYLMNRLNSITSFSETFNEEFTSEARAKFGWVKPDDVVDWPNGGAPAILPEWSKSYALDKDVAWFKSHSHWKIKNSKDAQHAVKALDRCKQRRDHVTADEAFIRKWQRKWQKDILAQTELMFKNILQPLEQHRRTMETTGQVLSSEIAGYARRQTM